MPIRAQSKDEPLFVIDRAVRNEELILGMATARDRLVRLTVEHCALDVVDPTRAQISRCRFVQCVVRPRKKVQISCWTDNAWESCQFHGHYESTHFGLPSDVNGPSPWGDIAVRDCDFSQATMHFCWFKRTDVGSTRFPPWPCFTVLSPEQHRLAWQTIPLPLPSWQITSWFSESERSDAAVFHWPSIIDEVRTRFRDYPQVTSREAIDADPEEVRRVLASLDFVRL
jgi:hypothetical protein